MSNAFLCYYQIHVIPADDLGSMQCRACAKVLEVPTMLLVGSCDAYFGKEMWQHLESHVQNCWLPAMLQNGSHWLPQDW